MRNRLSSRDFTLNGPLVIGSRLKSGAGGTASTASLGTMANVGLPSSAGNVDNGESRSKCTTFGAGGFTPGRIQALPLGSLEAGKPLVGASTDDVVAGD